MRAQKPVDPAPVPGAARVGYQLHHDALTGLPNRILFAHRLDEAMRHGRSVLIFIDLDDFKEITIGSGMRGRRIARAR